MPILTRQEMIDLTGADTPIKQRNVLKKHKIQWIDKADGSVVTTLEAVNHTLIGVIDDDENYNWDAI